MHIPLSLISKTWDIMFGSSLSEQLSILMHKISHTLFSATSHIAPGKQMRKLIYSLPCMSAARHHPWPLVLELGRRAIPGEIHKSRILRVLDVNGGSANKEMTTVIQISCKFVSSLLFSLVYVCIKMGRKSNNMEAFQHFVTLSRTC